MIFTNLSKKQIEALIQTDMAKLRILDLERQNKELALSQNMYHKQLIIYNQTEIKKLFGLYNKYNSGILDVYDEKEKKVYSKTKQKKTRKKK